MEFSATYTDLCPNVTLDVFRGEYECERGCKMLGETRWKIEYLQTTFIGILEQFGRLDLNLTFLTHVVTYVLLDWGQVGAHQDNCLPCIFIYFSAFETVSNFKTIKTTFETAKDILILH